MNISIIKHNHSPFKYEHLDYDDLRLNLSYVDENELLGDISNSYSDSYKSTFRLIVIHENNQIIGICKLVRLSQNKPTQLTISVLSVHTNYQNKGISKILLDNVLMLMKTEFNGYTLTVSKYSVKGFKFLRNKIIKMCTKNNIEFEDNLIAYYDDNEVDEFYKLVKENKELQNKFKYKY